MGCECCLVAQIQACTDDIVVRGAFLSGNQYNWKIVDKFGNNYKGSSTADGNNWLTILATDLPDGFLNEFGGDFEITFTDASDRPFKPAIQQFYDCIEVKVIKCETIPDPDVEDPEPIVGFIGETQPLLL